MLCPSGYDAPLAARPNWHVCAALAIRRYASWIRISGVVPRPFIAATPSRREGQYGLGSGYEAVCQWAASETAQQLGHNPASNTLRSLIDSTQFLNVVSGAIAFSSPSHITK